MLTMNAACKIWRTQVHKSQSEKEYKNFQNFIKLNLLKFQLMKKNFSHSGCVFSKWFIFSWSNQHLWLCWHILWWGTEVCWQGDLAARLCPQTWRTWRFLEWESQMGPSWSCRLWSMWSFLGRKPSVSCLAVGSQGMSPNIPSCKLCLTDGATPILQRGPGVWQ